MQPTPRKFDNPRRLFGGTDGPLHPHANSHPHDHPQGAAAADDPARRPLQQTGVGEDVTGAAIPPPVFWR